MAMVLFRIFNKPFADSVPLPLVTSPWPVCTILMVYLLFVLKLGKKFMEKRQPYNLKYVLLAYNVFQVLYNGYLFGTGIYWLFMRRAYNFSCMEQYPQDHHLKNTERMLGYLYYMNKIIDLLDTIFFVLRKSFKQISPLHVYHHTFMVGGGYLMIRFVGYGGHIAVMGFLNCFVHTVMYAYYFITALHPNSKQSIWWKKYITGIQILQFIILFVYTMYVMIVSPNCSYPRVMMYICACESLVFLYLFTNFYVKAYLKTSIKKEQ